MGIVHVSAGRVAFVVAHTLLLVSCGIEKPPVFLALETEHFEFYREDTLPPACDALAADLEDTFSAFSAYLEVPYPAGHKVIYNQFSTLRYLSELCGTGPDSVVAGCYSPDSDVIASVYPVYPHELVHVLEHRIGGPGHHPLLLSEGLASMLGGGAPYDRLDHRVDATLPVEDLIDDAAFVKAHSTPDGGGALYSTSAGFVRYLIDRYGKESFLRFYAGTRGLTSAAETKARFSETLLDQFDDVVADWRSQEQPLVEELPPTAPGCSAPSAFSPGDAMQVDPQCDIAVTRFDVPATGRADLVFDPQGSIGTIALRSCTKGSVIPERDLLLNTPLRLALDVPPGPYELVASGTPFAVTYASGPVTIDVDGTCDSARVPASIGGDSGEFAVVRRWGSVETSVAFDALPVVGGTLEALSVGNGSPGTAPRLFYLCPEGCSSDLDGACLRDEVPPVTHTDGTVSTSSHNVVESALEAGSLIHFGTGPRFEQDWGYSVRISVER